MSDHEANLALFFKGHSSIVLAFFGGVDSSYLLCAALKADCRVQPYYVKTCFQPQFENADARRLCRQLGVEMRVVEAGILSVDDVRANPANRCYFCKHALFSRILSAAAADGFSLIADGTNASDDASDRPGMRALRKLEVRSPLREAGLTKAEIRECSRQAGLFTWDKPAYACLATRIPAGTPLSAQALARAERAEDALRSISGCIVTADAMSCQREIAKKIIAGKGDYVLSLKENQPTLHEYAETCFKDALVRPQWYPEMTTCETVDKRHGRIEKRTYYPPSDLSGLENAADWSGLSVFGMVRSHVTMGEVESSEIRYAITSLKSVEHFAHAWRKHWGIENGLHYCLDVSFSEDHSRIRTDHAPENLAVVRHFALSALKQLPESKRASIKRKRKICAYDLDFLSSAIDLRLL